MADVVHPLEVFLGLRGIEIRSLADGIGTMIGGGRMVLRIMGALAEFERDWIQVGTKVGHAAAKKRGKRRDRPPVLTEPQVRHAEAAMSPMREIVSGMAELQGVDRSDIQRTIGATR